MAHPKETRDRLRQLYVSGNQTLETAAIMCGTTQATARRWREQARERGDDWDKMRAAYTLAGGSIEELGRATMAGFLQQYSSTMELLQQDGDLGPAEKVKLLASLADAYNKTVAANKRVLPEIQESAVAIKVIEKLFAYIADRHPDMLAAFDEVLQGFQTVIEKEF
ncbi:DNA-binding protein [Eikenella sp. NML03-A-027]|uniref:DUF1804 family protein n=1 Tax=Eikenella sp. NML03-A-027 TaxID=1795828 RepID=UPI0007DF58E7|nr:DUF1804 family protein [Eikenella sp. NML03-A-027]OAM30349.1 DNA-binding protein [Eikenella sp. NML03-A-027]